MIVVMNRLSVPDNHTEHLKKAFLDSTKTMNQVSGFIDFQLMQDKEKNELCVYTKWQSEDDYNSWKTSEAFQKSHQGASNFNTSSQVEILDVIPL